MKGRLRVSVSKNMMYVIARIDKNGTDELTESYINSKLEELGVKTGMKPETIRTMIADATYEKEYVIAEGKQPTSGKDGYYSFFFDSDEKEYQPTVLADGSVDYSVQRELVKAGDLLAQYHPSKPGVFGYTVFANIVAPIPVKELPALKLRNVKRKDLSYYAETDGEVTYQNGKLMVNNVLTIKENATNIQGAIHYVGDIHVYGDVLLGTTITADGNIVVDGAVESATVTASKDIIIQKGIFGRNKAVIKAGGSIRTAMIEEAEVTAGESITFHYSYCSVLTAGEDIIADTKSGKVIGGITTAGNAILVKYAGNSAEIKTILRIQSDTYPIDPKCKIAIERGSYRGTELTFGNQTIRNVQENGEYHIVDGDIHHYMVNAYPHVQVNRKPIVDRNQPTILLVDDQPVVLKTFYSYLRADYHVLAVNSAKDAFALMEHILPDLILLDYKMPNMDGGAMLQNIRNATKKRYHDVPVIFITAVADREIVEKCLLLFPQGYLIKPLKKEELLEAVNNFFAGRD